MSKRGICFAMADFSALVADDSGVERASGKHVPGSQNQNDGKTDRTMPGIVARIWWKAIPLQIYP